MTVEALSGMKLFDNDNYMLAARWRLNLTAGTEKQMDYIVGCKIEKAASEETEV
jgi:hypothetical protein